MPQDKSSEQSAGETKEAAKTAKVEFSQSSALANRLASFDCSLAFTSYQSGFLYLLGAKPGGGLHLHQTGLRKPMGIHQSDRDSLTLACDAEIIHFRNVLGPNERINNANDICFVPRRIDFTGALDAHDIGIDGDGRCVFVNTRFNCLATTSAKHSFAPIWKPPFVDEIVDEDRCHLNGMAMRDGKPAYVTAVSRSNTIDGWRDRRRDGGVVIDVARSRVVCEGLSMPHSPRWHNGKLWVLNSGTGELGTIEDLPGEGADESAMGRFEPRVFCPGFLRGLSFHGGFAFVGLSKPRYKRFEGLDLEDRLKAADSEPWCGVQIIDLAKGSCVDWFRIDGDVAELYDVHVLRGRSMPMALSPNTVEAVSLLTWEQPDERGKPWSGLGKPTSLIENSNLEGAASGSEPASHEGSQ